MSKNIWSDIVDLIPKILCCPHISSGQCPIDSHYHPCPLSVAPRLPFTYRMPVGVQDQALGRGNMIICHIGNLPVWYQMLLSNIWIISPWLYYMTVMMAINHKSTYNTWLRNEMLVFVNFKLKHNSFFFFWVVFNHGCVWFLSSWFFLVAIIAISVICFSVCSHSQHSHVWISHMIHILGTWASGSLWYCSWISCNAYSVCPLMCMQAMPPYCCNKYYS